MRSPDIVPAMSNLESAGCCTRLRIGEAGMSSTTSKTSHVLRLVNWRFNDTSAKGKRSARAEVP